MSETGDVVKGLKTVLERMEAAYQRTPTVLKHMKPRLVAVSKTKPNELIVAAYNSGQRHFGENYIQELNEKGNSSEIKSRCPEICWHFIGHLQRNKISKLLSTPNLHMVETVDSKKLATALHEAIGRQSVTLTPLRVMVQVNTSDEQEKSGCETAEAAAVVEHVMKECPNLKFQGIMTIGRFGYDLSLGPNPDFQCLLQCRTQVCQQLGLNEEAVELSMGMSDDFEHAIENGSTNVRVGSSIFGVRAPKTV